MPALPWQTAYAQAYAQYQQQAWAPALALLLPLTEQGCTAFEVMSMAAVLLERQHRLAEALALWQAADRVHPGNLNVWTSLGRVLAQQAHYEVAERYFLQVLRVNPKHLDTLLNYGNALKESGRHAEAIGYYRQLLPLDGGYARIALFAMGNCQQHLLDFDAARISYQQLLIIEPGHLGAMNCLLFSEHYRMPQPLAQITAWAKDLGERHGRQQQPYQNWLTKLTDKPRLRIGLVSADLRDHPVGYFLESLLCTDATQALEWFAYSNHDQVTPLTGRLRARCAQWLEVMDWSDAQLAARIRDDCIDVLVDLSGHTTGNRLGVFACKPAPLQVSWLGYFGTTGLPCMDAVIADPHCVPEHEAQWFTEAVWRLPYTRFSFTPPTDAPAVAELPARQRGQCCFGSFQDDAHINDTVLAAWARIGQAAPDARWRVQSRHLEPDTKEQQALLARMVAVGMNPARITFVGGLPYQAYLAAYGEVDVVLDTFPYPGGTKTADALWMGVPTLTLAQPGMLGRQGQQIMTAAGLGEWVTKSIDDYVVRAVQLAQSTSWPALAEQRAKMRASVTQSPLFDSERFARDWVSLIQSMWKARLANPKLASQGHVVSCPDPA